MKKGWKKIIAGTRVQKVYQEYLKKRRKLRKQLLEAEARCIEVCLSEIRAARNIEEATAAFGLVVSLSWRVGEMEDALDRWSEKCSSILEAYGLYQASAYGYGDVWENSAKARWEKLSRDAMPESMPSEAIWAMIDDWAAEDKKNVYSAAMGCAWRRLAERCASTRELADLREKARGRPYYLTLKYEDLHRELYFKEHGEYPRYFPMP